MKKHILLPAVLFIYLAFIAYFTYPSKNISGGIGYFQYYISIGATVIVIVALAFFLKKQRKK
jgi:hypothetical protein